LFEDHELEASGWRESTPDWDETLVEAHWSLVLEDLGEAIDETVIDLSVRWLVHESSSNEIEWRDGASHEETGREGGHELKLESIWDTHSLHSLFASIIACHLGGVQNHSSHNISLNTLVKTSHTLFRINFIGEVFNTVGFGSLVCHHSSLEDIEWVSCK